MSSEVLTQLIAAGTTVTFGQGRIFNLLSAPGGPVTIIAERKTLTKSGQSQIRKFSNIPAGSKFTADKGDEWTFLRVTSASLQTIQIFVGDEDMQFNNAVTVTGVAAVQLTPSSALTDQAGLGAGTVTGQHTLFAANAARRRVTVYADPTNTATVFLRAAGGANDLGYIQPGTFEEFDTTVGMDYRDPSAGGQKLYLLEES